MPNLFYDTSVYIPLFREGKRPHSLTDPLQTTIYLSSVVLQELYVGAVDPFSKKMLDGFYETFRRFDRIVTPTESEWRECGKSLSTLGQAHGYDSIRKGRLVNDVLIALSCQRTGSALLTYNHKDFEVIQEVVEFDFIKA